MGKHVHLGTVGAAPLHVQQQPALLPLNTQQWNREAEAGGARVRAACAVSFVD